MYTFLGRSVLGVEGLWGRGGELGSHRCDRCQEDTARQQHAPDKRTVFSNIIVEFGIYLSKKPGSKARLRILELELYAIIICVFVMYFVSLNIITELLTEYTCVFYFKLKWYFFVRGGGVGHSCMFEIRA